MVKGAQAPVVNAGQEVVAVSGAGCSTMLEPVGDVTGSIGIGLEHGGMSPAAWHRAGRQPSGTAMREAGQVDRRHWLRRDRGLAGWRLIGDSGQVTYVLTALPADIVLADDELELRVPDDVAVGGAGWPVFLLGIFRRGSATELGRIIVRLAHDDPGLVAYAGHVAYEVAPEHRGSRVALRATRLVGSLALRYGFSRLWITTTPENTASCRTIELLGADYVDTVAIPLDSDMRKLGIDRVRRYCWTL